MMSSEIVENDAEKTIDCRGTFIPIVCSYMLFVVSLVICFVFTHFFRFHFQKSRQKVDLKKCVRERLREIFSARGLKPSLQHIKI